MYFSKPFYISPSAPITTGIVVPFIPHIRSISISRSLYFDSFSVTLTEVFFSVGMDISMSRQLFSCLSFITMSGLLAFISQSVCIGISYKIVMLSLSVTVWGSCSYHLSSTFILTLCICSSVGMRRLCHVCVGIQFWPAQGTLPRYDQWFPGIDHISCKLGLYHRLGCCYDSNWS